MAGTLAALLLFGAFPGAAAEAPGNETGEAAAGTISGGAEPGPNLPDSLQDLRLVSQTSFEYADMIDIYHFEGGYKYFDLRSGEHYLMVPEGATAPKNLSSDITIIPEAPQNVYMAATAAMALVNAADGLDRIRFSSIRSEGWYVEEAKEAMEAGDILFAGKYSEPDYELLLAEGCDLAVESTMILHTPQVKEMLENLGIPVFTDRSSYEEHPLARCEWVKVYGELFGKEEEAEAFFGEQMKKIEALGEIEDTGKTVAFFSISGNGNAIVRNASDYVPKMIEMAGGHYVPAGLKEQEETKRSTMNMTMEEFFAGVADADYLVYNASIEAPIRSIDELLGMSPLFAECKAVREGNVWCADRQLYQATDIMAQLVVDFHEMLTGADEDEMIFLRRVG